MNVEVTLVKETEEEGAIIRTTQLSDTIGMAVDLLEGNTRTLVVSKEEKSFLLDLSKIYYIESVDNKSFVYTKSDCYETKYKLYELEDILGNNFFRCSKAMICNIRKIRSVKAGPNARMEATLLSDEMIVISRSYVKALKKKLGL